MRGRLALGRAILLATLLASTPDASNAQRYGYGGHWHGGYAGARYGYGGYGYRPYYGYGGYHPYYGGYHPYYGYAAWGFPGAMLGAVLVPRPVYYYPVLPSPPPPAA